MAGKKLLLEIADGLLAQRTQAENGNFYLPSDVLFPSGEGVGRSTAGNSTHLFWAAYRWTGDEKYLLPVIDQAQGKNYNVLGFVLGFMIKIHNLLISV